MDLIILLIKLIAKLSNSGDKRVVTPEDRARQTEIARQIQQRIEEARRRATADPNAPMMAQLPTPRQLRIPQQRTANKKARRTAPPPLPAVVAAAPAPVTRVVADEAQAPKIPQRPAAPSADARLLARWLRPQTLRSQFILTEVFQPPLSLREPPHW